MSRAADELYQAVDSLESPIADLRDWSLILQYLGEREDDIEPDAVHVIGKTVKQLGDQLEDIFNRAHDLAGTVRREASL